MTTIYSADGQTVARTFRSAPVRHWVQDTDATGHYEPADTANGYYPLTEVPRPSPDHVRSVARDGDTFTEVWTFDAEREAARLAAETESANESTIRTQATSALDTNRAFIALDPPTNAQVLAQVRSLTRQTNGLIRLTLGQLDGTD